MVFKLKKRIGRLIIFIFLFEAKPSTNLVKFINSYKSASSRIIKKQYPVLKKSFMEKCFLENRLFYYNNWWSEY
jgi:putative transposase